MRFLLDLHFNLEKFNKDVERIRNLMEDYKILKSDLNYYTSKLERLYNSTDNYPSLEILYDVEDKQFSKCIDAVCVFQDIVNAFSRLEENEQTMFIMRRLENDILALDPIEAEFYFNYTEDNK